MILRRLHDLFTRIAWVTSIFFFIGFSLLFSSLSGQENKELKTPAAPLTSDVLVSSIRGMASDALVQENGQIIMDGSFFFNSGDESSFLTKFNPDGSVDLNFTRQLERWLADWREWGVLSMANQSPDKILVAVVQRNPANYITASDIIRITVDGDFDPTFSTRGNYGANNAILTLQPYADGRFLIGGRFVTHNIDQVGHIFRLTSNGAPDQTFRGDWQADIKLAAACQTIALGPNQEIVLGKSVWINSSKTQNLETLLKLNPNGEPIRSFLKNTVRLQNRSIYSVAFQKDGKILVGGQGLLVRLNPDGTLDKNFSTLRNRISTATPRLYTIRDILVQPDGKIIVGGDFLMVDGRWVGNLARFEQDGTLDLPFMKNLGTGFVTVTHDQKGVSNITLQPDGKILVVGPFEQVNGQDEAYISRVDADGTPNEFPEISTTSLPLGS